MQININLIDPELAERMLIICADVLQDLRDE